MKDWIKVLISSVTTALVTIIVVSAFAYPGNINKKFKDQELKIIVVEKNIVDAEQNAIETAKEYTDKIIDKHAEIEKEQKDMIIKHLDQRFSDLEKLIEATRK